MAAAEETDVDPDEGGEPEEYADPEEAQSAIRALTSADKKKLMVAAKFWWKRFSLQATSTDPDDLLQEAILRTLRGDRRWRKARVSIVKHLDRAMESVASHHPEQLAKERRTNQTLRSLDPPRHNPAASAPRPPHSSDPESHLSARQQLDAIRALFGDDTQGFEAVCCRACGMEASEIQSELGIDSREWETLRKRVQRRLAKYLEGDREET